MAPSIVINAVAALSKALLRLGCRDVQVNGLDNFLKVLQDQSRREQGQGILTYCNHISVMDEPTIWGCLPWWTFRSRDTTRWTLGASDIMFTNDTLRRFFTSGQVIETHRGGGIFQPSIDAAIAKLEAGQWIHLFPEGYVNVGTSTKLRRFKWGLSRMITEAAKRPVVVPIWITGFDHLMPEPRSWPKFLPRPGASVSITFGEPIQDSLSPLLSPSSSSSLSTTAKTYTSPSGSTLLDDLLTHSSERNPKAVAPESHPPLQPNSRGWRALQAESTEVARRRSQIAAALRWEMAQLGRRVRILNGLDPETEVALCHTATTLLNPPSSSSSSSSKGGGGGKTPVVVDDDEEGKRQLHGVRERVERRIQRGLGNEVKRKEAEEGWKDSAT